MSNYLFLGGAGFIGSAIVRKLFQDGTASITVLEPDYADISRLRGCGVGLVRGTIDDTDIIERTIRERGITTVVHLVSAMTPGSSYHDYLDELRNVVRPTIRLIELCSRLGVRLVYFSSGGAIYGENAGDRPFRETDRLQPISYYGLSKLLTETNIRFEHRVNGLQYLILRPSNPYGPGQRTDGRQGLIAVAVQKMLAGHPLTVWGDGTAVRDYIYIDDLAAAVVAALASDASNEAINIGSGEGLSVSDIIGHIADVSGHPVRIQYGNTRKRDPCRVVLDVNRLRQYYRQPLTPIRKGIRLTIKN